MKSIQGQLPGGLITPEGLREREYELHAMTGRDEEVLAENSRSSAETVTEILTRCLKKVGNINQVDQELIRSLLVVDRQYLMMRARQLSFGDRVDAVVQCVNPDCRKRMDIDFNLSDVPITPCEVKGEYLFKKSDVLESKEADGDSIPWNELRFRLPSGEDQERLNLAKCDNEVDAVCMLLEQCIVSTDCGEKPDLQAIKSWPVSLRREIEDTMEKLAPNLELTMDLKCPECGTEFEVPFAIQDFFLKEVRANVKVLHREVHQLAFHYHWGEDEIMSMPRQRRQNYVGLLNEEIERINESIQ